MVKNKLEQVVLEPCSCDMHCRKLQYLYSYMQVRAAKHRKLKPLAQTRVFSFTHETCVRKERWFSKRFSIILHQKCKSSTVSMCKNTQWNKECWLPVKILRNLRKHANRLNMQAHYANAREKRQYTLCEPKNAQIVVPKSRTLASFDAYGLCSIIIIYSTFTIRSDSV